MEAWTSLKRSLNILNLITILPLCTQAFVSLQSLEEVYASGVLREERFRDQAPKLSCSLGTQGFDYSPNQFSLS